jgi:DNA-binding PadR family transcriptional regulator
MEAGVLSQWRSRYPTAVIQSIKLVPKTPQSGDADRDLYSGLIRLHILHHATEEPIFGLGMAEELARHGYRISPGTLYPLLDGLEKKGYLRSSEQRHGKSRRRVFRATPLGRRALAAAKVRVRELFAELIAKD